MTSFVDTLAQIVSRKLGRRVILSRYRIAGFKSASPTVWRYCIAVEGVHVVWRDLNINEAKGRLAMLSDLLSEGAILPGRAYDEAQTTNAGGVGVEHFAPRIGDILA